MPLTPLTQMESDLVQQFLQADPADLALKLHRMKGIDRGRVLQQIVSRQKAQKKLPDWYEHNDLFFPPPVSVEQASSQATARYKASLIEGEHLVDLTLGMGVDAFYFSKRFNKISAFESNSALAEITAYNMEQWKVPNIKIFDTPVLSLSSLQADWIYADPSRRDAQRNKTVAFEDSSPNVLNLITELSSNMMIKSSPLIDIDQAVKQLLHVKEVHIIGYRNECKELLFILDPNQTPAFFTVHAVLLGEEGETIGKFSFTRSEERAAHVVYGPPSTYLYEPHPALLKSGGFNLIAEKYQLIKLAPNSHLYTSQQLRTDFPGRTFIVKGVVNATSFVWKDWLENGKANLTLRNFPAQPDDLRKKWRLKEGGQDYLFATTLATGKRVVILAQKPDNQ